MSTEKIPTTNDGDKKVTDEEVNKKLDERTELVTRGLQETLMSHSGELKMLLSKVKDPVVYWGTSPTGEPHVGYFVPLLKIADLIDAGLCVTILLADVHAYLEHNSKNESEKARSDLKSYEDDPVWKKIVLRTMYYKAAIIGALEAIGADVTKVKFVIGSTYQLSPRFMMDVMRLGNVTDVGDAIDAGSQVVKTLDNKENTHKLQIPKLNYPLMQALDEHYLQAHIELGGIDQRKIFVFARDNLAKIGYKTKHKTIHLMNPIVPGLSSEPTNGAIVKMSSSNPNGKIKFIETPKDIKKKVNTAFCRVGECKDNTVLTMYANIVFPILKRLKKLLKIDRKKEHGGPLEFNNFEDLEKAFADQKLHPDDLKCGLACVLSLITEPIRTRFESKQMKDLIKKAYP